MRKYRAEGGGNEVCTKAAPTRQKSSGSSSPQKRNSGLCPKEEPETPAEQDQEIVIHVRDETRKADKDYICSRKKLLKHMKYFECYLKDSYDDVDISVHCDMDIFDWLMEYTTDPEKASSLSVSSVISILVSSDFLQMSELVDDCLKFMKDIINQVLRLPIDLSCLSARVIERLASQMTDEDIEALKDKRDKLQSRLYSCKVKQLIDDHPTLTICTFCKKIYCSDKPNRSTRCRKAKISIDFHGKILADHTADTNWDAWTFAQAVTSSTEEKIAWKTVYWGLWGHIHALYCNICDRHFPVVEHDQCFYHPNELVEGDDLASKYPCCNMKYLHFDPSTDTVDGCRQRNHKVFAHELEELQLDEGIEEITLDEEVIRKVKKYKNILTSVQFSTADILKGERLVNQSDDDEDKQSAKSGSGDSVEFNQKELQEIMNRQIPEHRKKNNRRKVNSQQHSKDSGRKSGGTFFELPSSIIVRRDMLREDDRRRVSKLLKFRDDNLEVKVTYEKKERKKIKAPPVREERPASSKEKRIGSKSKMAVAEKTWS